MDRAGRVQPLWGELNLGGRAAGTAVGVQAWLEASEARESSLLPWGTGSLTGKSRPQG